MISPIIKTLSGVPEPHNNNKNSTCCDHCGNLSDHILESLISKPEENRISSSGSRVLKEIQGRHLRSSLEYLQVKGGYKMAFEAPELTLGVINLIIENSRYIFIESDLDRFVPGLSSTLKQDIMNVFNIIFR